MNRQRSPALSEDNSTTPINNRRGHGSVTHRGELFFEITWTQNFGPFLDSSSDRTSTNNAGVVTSKRPRLQTVAQRVFYALETKIGRLFKFVFSEGRFQS